MPSGGYLGQVLLLLSVALSPCSSHLTVGRLGHVGLAADTSTRGSIILSGAAARTSRQIRICNAWAAKKPLSVLHARTKTELTPADAALPYKACRDFSCDLQEGDRLQFKAGGVEVGDFRAVGLDGAGASSELLLLIPHRRGAGGLSMSFISHAYADGTPASAQIVVIDASRWAQSKTLLGVDIAEKVEIADTSNGTNETFATAPRKEHLAFNSVADVKPGSYQLTLPAIAGVKPEGLEVQGAGKYVVLRVGVGDTKGLWPEELLVFPQKSSATSLLVTWCVALSLRYAVGL